MQITLNQDNVQDSPKESQNAQLVFDDLQIEKKIENKENSTPQEYQSYSPEKKKIFNPLKTSIIQEQQYFMQDSLVDPQMSEYLTPEKYYKMQKYCTQWNWNFFLEILVYHILQAFIFGPFCYFVLLKFTGKIILQNMQFIALNAPFLFQMWIYSLSFFTIIAYFILPENNTLFVEIFFIWILNFFRCITLSSRYGTFPKEKMRMFKNHVVPFKYQLRDSFLYFYDKQEIQAIYYETWSSFKIHEFDSSMFFLNFFTEPSFTTRQELNQYNLEFNKVHEHQEIFEPKPLCSEIQDCCFYGFGIIAKFLNEFEKLYKRKNWNFFGFLIGFIVSIVPICYQLSTHQFVYYNPFEIFRLIIKIFLISYLSSESLLFLIISIRNLQRKLFLLIQCAHLISPKRKDHYLEKKVLPTINIISPASIKGWSMLRQVCLTYGLQFAIRTKIFLLFLIIQQIVAIIFLLLFFFQIIRVKIITALYVGIWTIIFLFFLSFMLLLSAEINSFFEEFRNILEDLNTIFLDMQRMKKYYFEDKRSNQIFINCYNLVPKNFLHAKFVQHLNDQIQGNYSLLDEYIDRVNLAIEDAKRNIEFDFRNNQIQFFQIPITYELLGKIAVGIGTIFGFAIQQWTQKNSSESK